MADKYGTSTSGSYSWLPGFVRKFLNLDEELPGYGPSSGPPSTGYSAPSSPPPARPAPSYSAPGYTAPAPSYSAPSYTAPTPSYSAPTPSYSAPTYQSTSSEPGSYRMSSGAGAESPEGAAPRPESAPAPGTTMMPATSLPPDAVQPIGYAIRSFVRGALPPQGLEQFTREARGTFTDVWKFYSYWTRFQTDELFNMAGEFLNAVLPGRRTGAEGANGGREAPRRIRVTTANGEEKKVEPGASAPAPRTPTAAATPPPSAPAAPAAAESTAKAAEGAAKATEKAAEGAAKAAEKTVEGAAKAAEGAAKAAEKTVEGAAKAAEGAAKAAEKAAEQAADKLKDLGDKGKKR